MILSEAFLRALAQAGNEVALDTSGLEERLQELWRRAAAAWPDLDLDAETLVADLAAHVPGEGASAYLESVHIEDLALAAACSRRDARAIRELENRHLRLVPRALAQLRGAVPVEEIVQRLRERFLIGATGQGKIADYSGRGPLSAWVRAAAVRAGIDQLREQRGAPQASTDQVQAMPAVVGDPELDLLRARYAPEFQAALQTALQTLPLRDRNVLRFSYLDGLSIDEIAAFYRVHRATAARWIGGARTALIDETQRLVADRVALAQSELESLMRVLASQLDVSIRRLLG